MRKPTNQADRFYRIFIAIGGLILLAFNLNHLPQLTSSWEICLLIAFFTSIIVQFPTEIFESEIGLVQVVALGGGFIASLSSTIWAVALGMSIGYSFRWLTQDIKKWRDLFQSDLSGNRQRLTCNGHPCHGNPFSKLAKTHIPPCYKTHFHNTLCPFAYD